MTVCIRCGSTDVKIDELKDDIDKIGECILHTQVYVCRKCGAKFYEVDYLEEACYAELK